MDADTGASGQNLISEDGVAQGCWWTLCTQECFLISRLIAILRGRRRRLTIAEVRVLRHRAAMTWLAEIIIEGFWGFWEGAAEAAYRKWGWVGGAMVLLGPVVVVGLALWLVLR